MVFSSWFSVRLCFILFIITFNSDNPAPGGSYKARQKDPCWTPGLKSEVTRSEGYWNISQSTVNVDSSTRWKCNPYSRRTAGNSFTLLFLNLFPKGKKPYLSPSWNVWLNGPNRCTHEIESGHKACRHCWYSTHTWRCPMSFWSNNRGLKFSCSTVIVRVTLKMCVWWMLFSLMFP